jgi:hypothetical protein
MKDQTKSGPVTTDVPHNAQVPGDDIDISEGALTKAQRESIRTHRLADRGMLLRVVASRFNNKRVDKRATKELCADKSASEKAVQVSKVLVSKEFLSPVTTEYNRIRDVVRKRCLPWDGTGWVFVPIGVYQTVRAELSAAIAAKDTAVEDTAVKWEEVIKEQEPALGDLFNADDYPSPDEFRQAWDTNVEVQQIPSTDIRLDMDDDSVRDIANQVHKMVAGNLSGAWTESVNRLAESVKHAAAILHSTGDEDTRAAPVHDTLLENLKIQTDIVRAMGQAAGDKEMVKLADEVAREVLAFTAETLRTNPAVRGQVAKRADKLAQKVEIEKANTSKKVDAMMDDLGAFS